MATLILVGVAATGCASSTSGAQTTGDWPSGRTFLSTSVTDSSGERRLAPGTRIQLAFGEDKKLSGSAGCNSFSGGATLDGGRLVVGKLATTEMSCDPPRMKQDAWVWTFLGGKPSFDLDGDKLVLTGADLTITLADRRVVDPDRPLAGTTWVVDTILTGEVASSVPAGAGRATLVFDGAGLFSGSTGCAKVEGVAKVAADQITFSQVAGFDQPCTGSTELRDRMRAALLHGAVHFTIVGNRLTLINDAGAGLGLVG